MIVSNRFGQLIREYRTKASLLQDEVGDALDAHHGQISQWERGKLTPRVERVYQLAETLSIPVEVALAAWVSDVTKVPIASLTLDQEGVADPVEIDHDVIRGHVTRVFHEASGDEIDRVCGDLVILSTKSLGSWSVYYDDTKDSIHIKPFEDSSS